MNLLKLGQVLVLIKIYNDYKVFLFLWMNLCLDIAIYFIVSNLNERLILSLNLR
jgi:hypothetical protein